MPNDRASGAGGTVFYSIPARSGSYASTPLTPQGTNLGATLPTQDLGPGQRVAYYFEVFGGGEVSSLGSAQYPYITEIVDVTDLVQRSIYCDVFYTTAGKPVVFTFDPERFRATYAVVRYSPPDLAGTVEQPMTRSGRQWRVEVPAERVTAGAWTYRIEAEIDGVTYTHPFGGGQPGNFTVPAEPKKN
ncbi:MAG: hypothetical protein AAGC44_13135 [Planctomycetota bacterium]